MTDADGVGCVSVTDADGVGCVSVTDADGVGCVSLTDADGVGCVSVTDADGVGCVSVVTDSTSVTFVLLITGNIVNKDRDGVPTLHLRLSVCFTVVTKIIYIYPLNVCKLL